MFDFSRMRPVLGDPGQLYNIGNALVLAGGIGGATFAALGEGEDLTGAGGRIVAHFFGSMPAVALTIAMLVFFVSGAAYSRAWAGGPPTPDPRLNRWGDILSGVGNVILGFGLVALGDAFLAICAGTIAAIGKFGSAYAGTHRLRTHWGTVAVADICKDAVLLSRLPAFLAAAGALVERFGATGLLGPTILSLSLVVSILYWAMADILLLRRNGPLMTLARHVLHRPRLPAE